MDENVRIKSPQNQELIGFFLFRHYRLRDGLAGVGSFGLHANDLERPTGGAGRVFATD
jgi:hypothetical protein